MMPLNPPTTTTLTPRSVTTILRTNSQPGLYKTKQSSCQRGARTILFTVETQEELCRGFYPSIGSALGSPWKEESPVVEVGVIRFGCSSNGRLLFHNCATPD